MVFAVYLRVGRTVLMTTSSVDDLVITGNNKAKIAELEKFMKKEWQCTQYERVNSVLGVMMIKNFYPASWPASKAGPRPRLGPRTRRVWVRSARSFRPEHWSPRPWAA